MVDSMTAAMQLLEERFPDRTIILLAFPPGEMHNHVALIGNATRAELLPALEEIVALWQDR